MKNLILSLILALSVTTSSLATEITNPFYLSPKKTLTSQTTLSYGKYHMRKKSDLTPDYRLRLKVAEQQLSYGISPKVAILGNILNTWQRAKTADSITDHSDKNVDWSVGALYDLYHQNDLRLNLKMLYLQRETHHFGGAYKGFNIDVKSGYDLKYFLPYLGGQVEIPIAQRKDADNDPKYLTYAGIYKNFSDLVAADLSVIYSYDKHEKEKSFDGRAQINFFFTPKIALGGFFNYAFYNKSRHNGQADAHTIGSALKVQF